MAKKPESDSIIDMFARLGRELKMPDIDIERVIEHNRRNLEAFEQSARAAAAGTSTIMRRQGEMLKETLHDINEMAETYRRPSDPSDFADRHAEFARKGFETAVRNTGEVADLMAKSSNEALEILRRRIREGMEEIREGYEKRK